MSRRSGATLETRRTRLALVLLAPCLALLVGLAIYPTFYSLRLSFTSHLIYRPDLTDFVGFDNYRYLFEDGYFWQSVRITLLFTTTAVLTQCLLGFALALALDRELRYGGMMRTLLMIPLLISPVAVALTFRFLYAPSYGVINFLLGSAGLPAQDWIVNPRWALVAVVVADTWQWTPFIAVVLVAGLRSIPTEILEAADVDGLPYFAKLRWIILPLIMPVATVVILIRLIDSIRNFDLIYVLTRGGPGTSTNILSIFSYIRGFVDGDMGLAAAAAWCTVLLINLLVLTLLARLSRRVD